MGNNAPGTAPMTGATCTAVLPLSTRSVPANAELAMTGAITVNTTGIMPPAHRLPKKFPPRLRSRDHTRSR